jgi:LDH2 family malate/lactate/ureidoglycolate dehydrogenase
MNEYAKRILDAAMAYEINPECYAREITIAVLQEVARIPGDPERITEQKREIEGIPLNDKVVDDLKQLALEYSLNFPEPSSV